MIAEPGSNRLFVIEHAGRILAFDNDPKAEETTVILDITSKVRGNDHGGIKSLAFHPEFGQEDSPHRNEVFLSYRYRYDPDHDGQEAYFRLSRFQMMEDRSEMDPDSEEVLIQQYDFSNFHDGGALLFDREGFLYMSLGDEGGSYDATDSAQRLDSGFFSGVIRIDVDNDTSRSHAIRRQPRDHSERPEGWPPTFSQGYSIPGDNPWLDPEGGVLEEFYALGLRSPHAMSYDEPTGGLWVGDVGQGAVEEVDLIVKGGNYQWPYREGTSIGLKAPPAGLVGTEQGPVYEYRRDAGNCVIGGCVYRGAEFADLLGGKYIFGDNGSQNIWALTPGEDPVVENVCTLPDGAFFDGIASFGRDAAGEIYILKLGGERSPDGKILKFTTEGPEGLEPPALLSETGAFSDLEALEVRSGFLPYEPVTPFWSDGVLKRRWVAIPQDGTPDEPGEQITFSGIRDWDVPVGSVFIKHFDLPLDERDPSIVRRLETRFLVKGEENLVGFTYRWREDQSDAELLPGSFSESFDIIDEEDGEQVMKWDYPSRSACFVCHTSAAGGVLGFEARQLDHSMRYDATGRTANQLETFNELGFFHPPLDESSFVLSGASIHDESVSLEKRVRSYLDSNCSQCHQVGGSARAFFDARLRVPLAFQGLVGGNPLNDLGIPDAEIVKAGDPEASVLWQRLKSLEGCCAMPPLAKNRVDEDAVALVRRWIEDLGDTVPWPSEAEQVEQSEALVAHFKFDEGSGLTAADAKNNVSPGILEEGAEWTVGRTGGGLSFGENESYLRIPHHELLALGEDEGDFTAAFWMQLRGDSNGVGRTVLKKAERSSDRFFDLQLRSTDNRIHYRAISSDGKKSANGSSQIPLNDWAHVAYMKDGGRIGIFINGSEEGSFDLEGELVTNDGPFYLGGDPWRNGAVCRVDDLKIFNRALTRMELNETALGILEPDLITPEALLAWLPGSVADQVAFEALFSEDVFGLETADFQMTGGSPIALFGGPKRYVMVALRTSGPMEVRLRSDAAYDQAGNASARSDWLIVAGVGEGLEDKDGDGLPALLEEALGSSDSTPDFDRIRLVPEADRNLLELTRSLSASEIRLVIEFSVDLIGWEEAPALTLVDRVSLNGETEQLTFDLGSDDVRRFVRLRAERE
ncbi:MAG: PQQ-dependent sugar dehydrogenase [Verrucomicrobiota bacterium]